MGLKIINFMKKYKMLDGKIFEATSSLDLIKQMRGDSLIPEGTLKAYMVSVSESSYYYNGSNINIDTYDHFVEDLISNGFIKVV